MTKTLYFQDFWLFTIEQNKHGNGLFYHPCCDNWTTRNSKAKRASHKKFIKWQKLISGLDRSTEDKKEAFRAKMEDTGMKTPVVINKFCKLDSTAIHSKNSPTKAYESDYPEEEIQTDLNLQNSFSKDLTLIQDVDKSINFS